MMLPATAAPLVRFGPFTYDRARGLLRQEDLEVPLPPRVLGVLHLLLARAGEIVPRQELMDAVWKEAFVTDTSLAEAVSTLRQALGDDPQSPTYVQTVHRRGYRFIAPLNDPVEPPVPAGPASREEEIAVPGPSIGMNLLPWSVAAVTTLLAVVAVWQFTRRVAPEIPTVRMAIEPAPGTTFAEGPAALALSPDGSIAAWCACDASTCRLYSRALDRLEPRTFEGTEGAEAPFFSPDGRWIGFFASGKLKKIAVSGGAPVAVADAPRGLGAAWLPDGSILFASSTRGGLLRVPDGGGNPVVLTEPRADVRELGHAWPALLPDGRTIVFTVLTSPVEGSPARIAMLRLADGPGGWHTVVERAEVARPVTRDYLSYSRGLELHAVPFDALRLATAGEDQVVLAGVAPGQFATSANGALIHAVAGRPVAAALAWVRTGQSPVAESRADPGWFETRGETPALSPDGRRIAWTRVDDTATDIWVADLDRRTTTRLTHGGVNVSPAWSGDGTAVFYASARGGPFEIWTRDATASAPELRVLSAADRHRHLFPSSASVDGRLAYVESGGSARGDVGVLTPGGPGELVMTSAFEETAPVLSPDGRWMAYGSDESGRDEIYLMDLHGRRRTGVSAAGGTTPVWASDGSALFFQSGRALVRATVDRSSGRVDAPETILSAAGGTPVGVAPDGSVLVMRAASVPTALAALTIEWVREVRRALGPPTATLPR